MEFAFYFEIKKEWGISKEKHVINFKTEKEPKMKFFDFGAFQNKMQMSSHDKIIFHMLLGHFILLPVYKLCILNIIFSSCENCGRKWPVSEHHKLLDHLDKCEDNLI